MLYYPFKDEYVNGCLHDVDLGNGVGRVLVEDEGDGAGVATLPLELLVRALRGKKTGLSLVTRIANSVPSFKTLPLKLLVRALRGKKTGLSLVPRTANSLPSFKTGGKQSVALVGMADGHKVQQLHKFH